MYEDVINLGIEHYCVWLHEGIVDASTDKLPDVPAVGDTVVLRAAPLDMLPTMFQVVRRYRGVSLDPLLVAVFHEMGFVVYRLV